MRRFKDNIIFSLYIRLNGAISPTTAIILAERKASKQYGFLTIEDKFFTPTLFLN